MHIFYSPDIRSNNYILNEQESRHCSKVLRLMTGDRINLVDGIGGYYLGEILDSNFKRTEVKIIETCKEYKKRNYYLHIAIAPTKQNERFEWFLEKATEIGIDEISPIRCEHSERTVIKTGRFEKVLVTAMKQSEQAYLPKINDIREFKEVINGSTEQHRYMAHCHTEIETFSFRDYIAKQSVLVVIGPEGDFSTNEVEFALQNGFSSLSLGANRLRTETAGVVACHSISFLNDYIYDTQGE